MIFIEQKIKLTRAELMEILNIKTTALKKIESKNNLAERLNNKGYNFIEKIKEGRNSYYIVARQQNQNDKDVLTNIISCCYKTKKHLTFSEYYTIRYVFAKTQWQGASTSSIADYIGVSQQTVSNWDKLLKENEIVKQDGYYYYKRDMNTYEESEITKEEYNSYWKNIGSLEIMKKYQYKYDKGEITFNELTLVISDYMETYKVLEGKYCFRVKRYIINELNLLCSDIWKLIKKCYLTDIGLDYLKIHKKDLTN